MPSKIMIIEDDADISRLLVRILRDADYRIRQAFSGTEALLLLKDECPDLILLDLMLPGMSGETLLSEIRDTLHYTVPVLILSARSALSDKVSLLAGGADDYITKPFEPEEVYARVQAALRRSRIMPAAQELSYKALRLYPESRKVTVDDTVLELTVHEYDILYLLLQSPEKVYSRERLYELVWKDGYYGENNTVNMHISNLRKKIKAAGAKSEYIQTVYGIGFKLC